LQHGPEVCLTAIVKWLCNKITHLGADMKRHGDRESPSRMKRARGRSPNRRSYRENRLELGWDGIPPVIKFWTMLLRIYDLFT